MTARIVDEKEICYKSPVSGALNPVYAVAVDADDYEEAWELAKLAAQNHFAEAEMEMLSRDVRAMIEDAIFEAMTEYVYDEEGQEW